MPSKAFWNVFADKCYCITTESFLKNLFLQISNFVRWWFYNKAFILSLEIQDVLQSNPAWKMNNFFFFSERHTYIRKKFSHLGSGRQHLLCLPSLEQLIIITYVWSVEKVWVCFKAKFCVCKDNNFRTGFFRPWRCAKKYILHTSSSPVCSLPYSLTICK